MISTENNDLFKNSDIIESIVNYFNCISNKYRHNFMDVIQI